MIQSNHGVTRGAARRLVGGLVALSCVLTAPGIAAARLPAGGGNCTSLGTTVPAGAVGSPNPVTWDLAGSPYRVQGNIQVGHLTIDPGVCVVFEGNYELLVSGFLIAVGTANSPIVFTWNPGLATPWRGILFQDPLPGSRLEYCYLNNSNQGAIRITNSTPGGSGPILRKCRITDNAASSGGGVHVVLDQPLDVVFEDCIIAGNSSTTSGGGVHADLKEGSLAFVDCLIQDNFVNKGGSGCAGPTNTWTQGGGVYRIGANGVLDFRRCLISGNECRSATRAWNQTVRTWGGGIFNSGGSLSLENCVVRNNAADARDCDVGGGEHNEGRGGGVYFSSTTGSLHMQNCIVSCNATPSGGSSWIGDGSGVHVAAGPAWIENCTLANNTREGLWSATDTVTVTNSILYFNNAQNNQIAGPGNISVTYSDVQGCYPGTGNLCSTPVFVRPNGCGSADLVIASFSPVIDQGDPNAAYDDGGPCAAPPYGTARNDMGAHGGPQACEWSHTTQPLGLYIDPPRGGVGDAITIQTTGGVPGRIAVLFVVSPTFSLIPVFGTFCTASRWTLAGQITASPGPVTVSLRAFSTSATGNLISSNNECFDLQ